MEGAMFTGSRNYIKRMKQAVLICASGLGLAVFAPSIAQAGNVAWAVSVGGGYGGWRPAAYGPWGGWGSGWGGNYYGPAYGYPYGAGFYSPPVVYAAPPVITYASPPQPMVLAAQAQPPVWYFCQASGQYFPYVQSCPAGWQTQPAMPPASNARPSQGLTH